MPRLAAARSVSWAIMIPTGVWAMTRANGQASQGTPTLLFQAQFPQPSQESLRPIPLLLGSLLGCVGPGLRDLGPALGGFRHLGG